jgi:hypothetical protein
MHRLSSTHFRQSTAEGLGLSGRAFFTSKLSSHLAIQRTCFDDFTALVCEPELFKAVLKRRNASVCKLRHVITDSCYGTFQLRGAMH